MVCWRLSAVLFAACTAVILWPAQGQADGCTSGFMSLERMNRVLDNYIVGAPWNESALLPETKFTCSGSILNLTFAANLRGGDRSFFPEFQLWRPSSELDYQLVGRITFNQADRIGSTLVYQRNGSPLLNFQAGDVLGFYQPSNGDSKSRIRLAVRTPQPVQKMYRRDGNSSAVFTLLLGEFQLRNLLVSVVTDRPNCTGSGFMSNETLRTLVGLEELGRLVSLNPRQQITPDINFTCDGVITNWIIGAFYTEDSIPGPELQLWRKMENDTYVKVSGTIVTAAVYNSSLIYGNSSFSPIPFRAGDILGIFVPNAADSILKLRFEWARGPRNYFLDLDRTDHMSPHQQFNLTASVSSEVYHPLVSVEISVSTTSTSTSTSTTSTMQVGSTSSQLEVTTSTMQVGSTSSQLEVTTSTMQVGSTSSQLEVQPSSSVAVTPAQTTAETTSLLTPVISQSEFSTSTPIPSVQTSFDNLISSSSTTTKPGTTHTQSPSPPPGSPDSRSQSTLGPGIGAGVGVALLIAVLVVCVCLVIVRRRRRTSKVVLNGQVPLQRNFSNPVYENGGSGNVVIHGTIPAVLDSTYDSPYNDYDSVACTDSTAPGRTGKDTAAATEFDNPLYSDTGPVTFSEVTLYESTDFCGNAGSSGESFYVPTTLQRESTNEGVYSNPEDTLSKSTECTEYAYVTTGARNSEYFEESNIYWEPATNVSDLYQQLSRHKYREIPRQKIEVSVVLGSGQFGVVNRGKWLVGSVEVAIKTLRPEAKEEEKVKFLQEAAINGQFRHPNIVRLHGVVTVGEPVMIVLELLSNGDLRDFLNSLNSRPERQEQSQLAQLCLSFTQQIASGMSYLAGKDFVHRDLAARNILVSEGRICKVADFGMARDLEEGSYYVSHGGKIPVKWTAPEALHYKKYSTASDVWSFGCLMYEIWSLGHKPFEGYTNAQVMNLVTEGYRLSPPPGCPRAMYSLMMSSWNPERSSRPSFTSLHRSLTEDPAALLCWREGDTRGLQTQARHLGAPLEAGKDLYCDLQETYLQKQ